MNADGRGVDNYGTPCAKVDGGALEAVLRAGAAANAASEIELMDKKMSPSNLCWGIAR